MSVSNQTGRKIGLIGAILILIGSVIGIGIFFKNESVFAHNQNNGIGIIISWVIASIIALTTAFSFAEIGFGHRHNAGLSGSVELLFGHKFGRFINFNQTIFYYGLLNLSIGLFAAEALINIFGVKQIQIGYVFLLGLALMFVFLLFNFISIKWSSRFQNGSTIIKFIPLLMIGFAGIIYGAMHPNNSIFHTYKQVGTLSVQGILVSLPSVLFAYDSFLSVGLLKKEMHQPEKKVPLAIIIGMALVILVYLFVTIGQIMVSSGTAYTVFNTIFTHNHSATVGFNITISIFIFLSVIGALNAMVLTGLRSFQSSVDMRVVMFWYKLLPLELRGRENKGGFILSIIIYLFWWIVLLVPSVIVNSDDFFAGVSNFPTLFMFAIYGTVVLGGIINRFTKKVYVNKIKGFLVMAPISVLGCYLAFGYQFFYAFSVNAFIHPFANANWGLFLTNGYVTKNYMALIWFFTMIIFFVVVPFINDAFLKLAYTKRAYTYLLDELLVSKTKKILPLKIQAHL